MTSIFMTEENLDKTTSKLSAIRNELGKEEGITPDQKTAFERLIEECRLLIRDVGELAEEVDDDDDSWVEELLDEEE